MNKTEVALEKLTDSMPIMANMVENLQALFELLKWLVGGIFGLYLIFIFLKWYEFRKIRQTLSEVLSKMHSLDSRVEKIEKTVNKKKK